MLNEEQVELINLAIEELVNKNANSPYIQNAIDYINKVINILKMKILKTLNKYHIYQYIIHLLNMMLMIKYNKNFM